MPDLIRFEKADLGYGRRVVLRGLDLALESGQFVGLIGPNGAGKSTLLKTLMRLIPPIGGRVVFEDECIPGRHRCRIGYVPQRHSLDPLFPVRVRDVAIMGLYPEIGLVRRPRAEHVERTMRALETCGVAALADRLYRDLSGGQQQRTLLARALVAEPELLVMDEPTNDLDVEGERSILELVERLNRKGGRTVVFVSHNLAAVVNHATHLWLLRDGAITGGTVAELCTRERMTQLFGCPVCVFDCEGGTAILPASYKHGD